jgi:hypothetical protein
MLQLRIKPGAGNQKTIFFTNPKCGHKLEFGYSAPYTCQDANCSEKPPSVEKLIGEYATAQGARVKYYAEGKL